MNMQPLRQVFERVRVAFVKLNQTLAQSGVYDLAQYGFEVLRSHARAHLSLLLLTAFILVNNAIVVQAADDEPEIPLDTVVSDPYEIAETLRFIAPITHGDSFQVDPDAVAVSLEEQVSGSFLQTNPLIATLPGQTDDPTPAPTTSPVTQVAQDNRTKDVKYTVQIGDTLSGIGSKFDLKIATLKVKNNLSDVDAIKPGQELTIPVDDLSDKAIQAAEDRKKASAQLAQQTQTTKKIIATAKAGGYGLVVPIRHNGISRGLVGGHTGIDYRANTGTAVMSAADGVVVVADESGWNGGYGKTVLISHTNGMTTRYGHLSDVRVTNGQRVSQSEVIGLSGNTGRSTGPHLHFELRVNGAARNPF